MEGADVRDGAKRMRWRARRCKGWRLLLDPLEFVYPPSAKLFVVALVDVCRLRLCHITRSYQSAPSSTLALGSSDTHRDDRKSLRTLLLDALHHVPSASHSVPYPARSRTSTKDETLALDLEGAGPFGVVLDAEDPREVGEEE